MPNAFVTSAPEGEESIDQPTILREYVSRTAAQYTLPSRVRCSVMSVTHSWFGPGRANSRWTRSALMVSGGVYFHVPAADAHDARAAHQQLDRAVADRNLVAQGEFRVDASRTVDALGGHVDLPDQVREHL
jgi:hypothetical protein